MSEADLKTEAEAMYTLAHKEAQLIETGRPGHSRLIVPDGYTSMEIIDPDGLIMPDNIRQSVILAEAESLAEYVNRFKEEGTVLFANVAKDQVVAAIDYHRESTEDTVLVRGNADFVTHRATLQLAPSPEWAAWGSKDGAMLSQADFARFLEENREDVTSPTGAELIELCRELHAHRKAHWGAVARTNGPYERFEFQDDTVAGSGRKGDVEIPTEFAIGIPVYAGGNARTLKLFLRWTIDEREGLKLGFKIARREMVRLDAFREIAEGVQSDTGRPLVFGALA